MTPTEENKTADKQKPKVPVTQEQISTLKKCVNETLASYRRKRTRNKTGAIFVHLATIVLTIGTTIILGWQLVKNGEPADKTKLTNAALILSALVTGITTLDSVFDYRALWVGYNIAISRLKSVLSRLDYLQAIGAANLDQGQVEELYDKYDGICSSVEKDYKDIRTSND